ncbi:hypothetical protein [Aureispira anguillae]|uniref:Uncharacterized protein n=1 Tax=Aureispira anguillae TaxID=2864201 RepID=A0A915YB71_9BACT|nr:hypothetical protein [Aureispira anguillae]BDS09859.1 hypothetical protein AsAng_0005640 [Aureispira anguillae]
MKYSILDHVTDKKTNGEAKKAALYLLLIVEAVFTLFTALNLILGVYGFDLFAIFILPHLITLCLFIILFLIFELSSPSNKKRMGVAWFLLYVYFVINVLIIFANIVLIIVQ